LDTQRLENNVKGQLGKDTVRRKKGQTDCPTCHVDEEGKRGLIGQSRIAVMVDAPQEDV